MRGDTIWRNARLATCAADRPGLGLVENGLVAAQGGRIIYAGPASDAPAGLDAAQIVDCDGRWITPGLIDCHTHLVHGGDRSAEWQRRLDGESYEAIARDGGGILSTVRATRHASQPMLEASALRRLDPLLAEGVTTVEIKSGYGLALDPELRMLGAARALGTQRDVGIVTTFLGAHAIPPGAEIGRAAYVAAICDTMIPAVAADHLADAVDAFCEGIAFTVDECAKVFDVARRHGLPVRLHADQLSDTGGAALAARFGALSADHLEYASEAGVAAMTAAGTVAVVLPGAYYFMRETQAPPVALFRRHGVRMALATDCNPGTAPLTSLLLVLNMAATLFRMSVEECVLGVTREAARALGRYDRIGTLEVGKSCDLAIWDVADVRELIYRIGFNPLHQRVREGRITSAGRV